jgi:signal transduction histidine kinase
MFYEPLAEDKQIKLQLEQTEILSLVGDRDMLFQLFTNVIDNAIKYTQQNGLVKISINKLDDKAIQVVITDDGIGIPDSEKEKVFEHFYRLEKHRTQAGNGLGLSLVNAIAKVHGGQIELMDNHPGLRVKISLPVSGP